LESLDPVWNSEFMQQRRVQIARRDVSRCPQLCPSRNAFEAGGLVGNLGLEHQQSAQIQNDIRAAAAGCGYLNRAPIDLTLCLDATCNMRCRMCRDWPMLQPATPAALDDMLGILRGVVPHVGNVNLDKSGELLCSPLYRRALRRCTIPAHVDVSLYTNGHLFTEENLADCGFDKLGRVYLGCDACTAQTYEQLRIGASFTDLRKRLPLLTKWREDKRLRELIFVFVANTINFREMPAFVTMAKDYGATAIEFKPMFVFDNAPHRLAMLAAEPWHEKHPPFLEVLQDPRLADPIVRWTEGLFPVYRRALSMPSKDVP